MAQTKWETGWEFLEGKGGSDKFGHADLTAAFDAGKTKTQIRDYLDAQHKAGKGLGAIGWAKNKAGQEAGQKNTNVHGQTVWDLVAPGPGQATSGTGPAGGSTAGGGSFEEFQSYFKSFQDQMSQMQDQYAQQQADMSAAQMKWQEDMMRRQREQQLEMQRRQDMVRTAAPSVVNQAPVMGIQASAQAQGSRGMSAADWSRTAPTRSQNVGLNV